MMTAPDAVARFARNRPLCLGATCYALGAFAGVSGHVPAPLWGALAAATGVLFALRRRMMTVFLMLLFTGAWAASSLCALPTGPVAKDIALTGRVCQAPVVDAERVTLTLDDVTLSGARHPGRLRLYLYEPAILKTGDVIALTADTWVPQGMRNPGGFDFAAWLRRADVRLCATGKAGTLLTTGSGITPQLALEWLGESIGARLDQLFPTHGVLARALLLGDKPAYTDALRTQFRLAGVAHLMAVSGLHVTCLALALGWLLRALGLSRRRAFLVTLPLIVLYALVVGLPASALRAALMYAMLEGARLSGRPHDPLTGLSAALLVILAFDPLMIADPGLILSFSAVAGILLLYPTLCRLLRTGKRGRVMRWLLNALAVSLAAQLGTLPAACCLFGTLTPYALITNLAAIPLCTLALPLTAAAAAVSTIVPALGPLVAVPPDILLGALTELTALAARLPGAEVYVPAWPGLLICAYAALCVWASPYLRTRPRARYGALLGLPALLGGAYLVAALALPSGLSVVFLDAGQADAAVIYAERRVYLMDVGETTSPTPDYLTYTGQRVDGVFLTHPHSDHAGGLNNLLLTRHVPVIYLPDGWDQADADPGVREAVAEAVRSGTQLVYLRAGDQVPLSENVLLTVLGPPGDGAESANALSLVTRLTYGRGAVLLTGDIPSGAEPADMPDAPLLKVAHHGAASSTSEFMVRAVSPAVAVISVGRNGYGHPSKALLDRLARVGAAVYRTDQMGAITARIQTDGTTEMERFL